MGAFWSGTDDGDDKTKILITGVVGKLNTPEPAIIFRMNRYTTKQQLRMEDIFDTSQQRVAHDPAWLDRIQTFGGYYSGANKGYPQTGYTGGTGVSHAGFPGRYDEDYWSMFEGDFNPTNPNGVGSKPVRDSSVKKAEDVVAASNETKTTSASKVVSIDVEPEDVDVSLLLGFDVDELRQQAGRSITDKELGVILEAASEYGDEAVSLDTCLAFLETGDTDIFDSFASTNQGIDTISSSDVLLVQVIQRAIQNLGPDGQTMLQEALFGKGV